MTSKIITTAIVLALAIALLLPAAIAAQDDTGKTIGIFGEIINIDKDAGTVTVQLKNGETAVLGTAAGSGMASDWQAGLDDLAIGERLCVTGQQTALGQYNVGPNFFVKPSEPTFTHKTGVVSGGTEAGWKFQGTDGVILGGLDSVGPGAPAPDGEGVFFPGGWGFNNGDVVTGVFQKGAKNSPALPKATNFKPFTDIIQDIGNNLKAPGLPPGGPTVDVSLQIIDTLGALDQYIPPQVKTETKTKMKTAIGQSLPENIWGDLPATPGKAPKLEAWGFVPDDAFGKMNADVFGQIPDDAFAFMDANAFAQMPAEAFGKMNPEAFSKMPTEAFGKMGADAFAQMPNAAFDNMKPEAFGQIPSGMQAIMAGKGPLSNIPVDLVNTNPELYNQMADQAFQDFWEVNNVPMGTDGRPTMPAGAGAPTISPAGMGWTQGTDGGWNPPVDFNPPAWWDAPEGWTGGSLPDGTAPWQQWTPGMEGDGVPGGMPGGTMGPGGPAMGDPSGGMPSGMPGDIPGGNMPPGFMPGGDNFDPNNPPEGMVPLVGPDGEMGWGPNFGPDINPGDEGWMPDDSMGDFGGGAGAGDFGGGDFGGGDFVPPAGGPPPGFVPPF